MPVPTQADDPRARLPVLLGYGNKLSQQGQQLGPEGQQAFMGRINVLLEQLEQVDTNAARQLRKELNDTFNRDAQAGAVGNAPAPPVGESAQVGAGR